MPNAAEAFDYINAPTMMIAEKDADMILADARDRPAAGIGAR